MLLFLLPSIFSLVYKGKNYKVEPLIHQDGAPYTAKISGETVLFNFIHTVNISSRAECTSPPAAVMSVSIPDGQEMCWVNAVNTTYEFVPLQKTDKGIQLRFSNGQGQNWDFKVMCGKKETEWVVAPDATYNYLASIEHPGGCAKGGGDGFGIAFFIILLVAAVLYFAIGIPVCKFGMKKSGKEIIPFVNFWIALPKLFIDGVKCMFSPCCKSKGGYEPTE
ncbi:hypothetical protein BLNAU_13058 [Blattamonas nauphoetae]|uniref:Uncharacterized protein n=1 Tax=Blattamonas nauphoetae TaxID=2049346 RepID=A0ABQ9XHN6_9EUKA|nr:hypothetical protein BLNAU_13058 [Blattamonas nauphoetae]